MPVYEYVCNDCARQFEVLLLRKDTAACPSCEGVDLKRMLSAPRVKSSTTRELAMRAAKKRDRAQAWERVNEQRKYEESHDRHG
ncbi:MAG: zinc ribbon domain-containing protein [Gammaproteobacteria bacterium]|nr:zinc ribbon domain-containing protein [Gammaproteobacteria bacterium]